MNRWATIVLLFQASLLFGQDVEAEADTLVLEEVVVKAFQSNRSISEVPAAIKVVDPVLMNRFSNLSLVSASNTVPGVRMEERSPGSYRFSIRGSLLRSPFGVRNVKFYWRGLPFTDGGGNTYLNLLDFTSIHRMEVIKGPGSSLYGAGTGGVVLLDPFKDSQIHANILGGSYGTFQFGGVVPLTGTSPTKVFKLNANAGYQRSSGYREQTSMGRWTGGLDFRHFGKTGTLEGFLFNSILDYETPGGLTLAQFEQDPRQARPATPTLPGAAQQGASIHNNLLMGGLTWENDLSERWTTNVGVAASYNRFRNPAILNYETRDESNLSSRLTADYFFGEARKQKITFGGEAQLFKSDVNVSVNNGGNPGTLATTDALKSNSTFLFLQADFQLPLNFFFTLGGSANYLTYNMNRLYPGVDNQRRDFEPGFFPRLALLKKIGDQISVYGTWSDGFSAPTFAEVLPNTGVYNNNLNPERGTNLEGGIKADLFERTLHLELGVYDFKLKNAIVNVNGGDDYQNAGETLQRGIEAAASWNLTLSPVVHLLLWGAYTLNNFHFVEYMRAGTDYSGNQLTGVPRHVVVGGFDLKFRGGWYLNWIVNRTDAIPLNDGNTEYADDYLLLGARVGKKTRFRELDFEPFAGIDNALDEKYSLGNDLNAAGARYYNAAPGRNYYVGIAFWPTR